jgi:uncharacterized damage-inducible protein DinB
VNPKLQYHYKQLEQETLTLLKDVSTLSSASYHYSPGEGKWSISQILTHIITAEGLSLKYLRKKSLGIKEVHNTGFIEDVKFWVLRISQRIPLRYKAPGIVIQNTPAALSYGELIRQWEVLREEMQVFLSTISEDDIQKKIYKHPVVGMLNVMHGVQFLREHIIHHRPQIIGIIRQVKKRN